MAHVVIWGVGQMGGVFAHGLLRGGHTVTGINRGMRPRAVARDVVDPELVLIAVGEDDLHSALEETPESWTDRLGLLQNELLPTDWRRHDIERPTVAAVWFEKKAASGIAVIRPTPIGGPAAGLLIESLDRLGIPAREVPLAEMTRELVRKNLYILTVNIAGLVGPDTVGELWEDSRESATAVAAEIITIQEALVGEPLDRDALFHGLSEDIAADPGHKATGRSAPARLQRALEAAGRHHIDTPRLAEIASLTGAGLSP